jgi:hypothetical protein
MSRNRSKKERQLRAFVQSLHRLWPDAPHEFICPICLKGFSIGDPPGATEAQIIPESAGGQETTFLCKDQKCPSCAELIRQEAKVCSFCGREAVQARVA